MWIKGLAGFAMVLALAGCVTGVREIAGEDGVQIVDLTPATVQRANLSPYEPLSLPEAFSRVAGAHGTLTGQPRLPDAVFDPETRPGLLQLRLPPATDPGPYRIGVGDVLILATRQGGTTVEELAGLVAAANERQGYTVQDDGAIAVPGVGRIMVAEQSIAEAEDTIFDRLIEARIDPSFSLEVAEFNSQRVSVGGAVRSPGLVPVTMTPLYLQEAIAVAGGIDVADRDYAAIRIYRNGGLYELPAAELYNDNALARIRLLAGDAVYVDTTYDLALAEAFFEEQIRRAEITRGARAQALAVLQQEIGLRRAALEESRSTFQARLDLGAEDRDYVYIAGEIREPGRFPLPFDNRATLADALFDAGGPDPMRGDQRQIYILRADTMAGYMRDVIAYRLDAGNPANLVLATRMELRPGDILYVAEQPVTRWNRVISQLLPTISVVERFE